MSALRTSVQQELNNQTIDDLMDSLSLSLMLDNIKQQVYGEIESKRDFLDTVLTKFRFILENGDFDDPGIKTTIKQEVVDFCNTVIFYIVNRYELAYAEDIGSEIDNVDTLYHFFVVNRESYVRTFILDYIEQNKQDICDTLQLESGSDICSLAIGHNKNIDPYNIKIVSNIDAVIHYILTLDLNPEDLLDILDDGDSVIRDMISLLEYDSLGGHFVNEYLSEVIDNYDSLFSTDIRNEIRYRFGVLNQ